MLLHKDCDEKGNITLRKFMTSSFQVHKLKKFGYGNNKKAEKREAG